jgi:hypothetical protein
MSGQALWGGQALRRWLTEGGRPARPSPLLSPARAMAFEAALALQRRLPPPPQLDPPPIFILGFWRSGTTLLHELLAALPGHVAPGTWQCFRPATLRLAPAPAERETVRPMDGRPVGTRAPQEDEFALLLLGAPSLYRGFLDPRRLDTLVPLLDGSGGDWTGPFEAFARAVLALAPEPARLVVKSPTHLFRQAGLRARWPAAPLLVPLRDPTSSWASALGMWRDMVALHGLWPAPEAALESFLSRAFHAAARHLVALAEAAEAGAPVAACALDALARDPAGTVSALLTRAGCPPDLAAQAALVRAAAAAPGRVRDHDGAPPPQTGPALAAFADASERLLRAAGV